MELTAMTNLERELVQLKKDISGMMHLVSGQIERAESAFIRQDAALAKEIHHIERRVDAADLSIDKECENLIALYNPVASDLRLILASIKIISHLERVGDHADKIPRYVRKEQVNEPYPDDLLKAVRLEEMFDHALEMLETAIEAFTEEDTGLAREVFAKDVLMNKIYSVAVAKMHKYAMEMKDRMDMLLYLFSVVNKLERVGDLAKNIAEETIFYIEAKVLKHKKVKELKDL
jgi:phosphate transport system protein